MHYARLSTELFMCNAIMNLLLLRIIICPCLVHLLQHHHQMRDMLSAIEHKESAARCRAERSVLRSLEGGCQIAMGVVSSVDGEELKLGATILSKDGTKSIEGLATICFPIPFALQSILDLIVCDSGSVTGVLDDPEALGQQLAVVLKEKGAVEILGEKHAEGTRPTTYGSLEKPQRTKESA